MRCNAEAARLNAKISFTIYDRIFYLQILRRWCLIVCSIHCEHFIERIGEKRKKKLSPLARSVSREHDRILFHFFYFCLFFRLKSAISINPINNSDFTWKSVGLRGGRGSYGLDWDWPVARFHDQIIHVRACISSSERSIVSVECASRATEISNRIVCRLQLVKS